MTRQIRVRVSPGGEITVEPYGIKGSGCEVLTKAIEDALGKSKDRVRKPEFWKQSQRNPQQQPLGGGEP